MLLLRGNYHKVATVPRRPSMTHQAVEKAGKGAHVSMHCLIFKSFVTTSGPGDKVEVPSLNGDCTDWSRQAKDVGLARPSLPVTKLALYDTFCKIHKTAPII